MIFFTKLNADIYRYLTEATQGTVKICNYQSLANKNYQNAVGMYKALTESKLPENYPVESLKLSLNLNFALFKKEI